MPLSWARDMPQSLLNWWWKSRRVALSSWRTCWRTTSAPKKPSPTPSWTESLWSPPKRRECRRSATSPPGWRPSRYTLSCFARPSLRDGMISRYTSYSFSRRPSNSPGKPGWLTTWRSAAKPRRLVSRTGPVWILTCTTSIREAQASPPGLGPRSRPPPLLRHIVPRCAIHGTRAGARCKLVGAVFVTHVKRARVTTPSPPAPSSRVATNRLPDPARDSSVLTAPSPERIPDVCAVNSPRVQSVGVNILGEQRREVVRPSRAVIVSSPFNVSRDPSQPICIAHPVASGTAPRVSGVNRQGSPAVGVGASFDAVGRPVQVPVSSSSAPDSRASLSCAAGPPSSRNPVPCSFPFSPLKPATAISPVLASELEHELRGYPMRDKANYILRGLRSGFRVGFLSSRASLKSASSNMASAALNPSVIDGYLQTELEKGRVAGPFPFPPYPDLHVSRFGVIPKKNQPGKWRLILDLSSPSGRSVNDGIPKEDFSIHYMKVDDIIAGIMARGRGSLMAKFDVESAYRIVPIHPEDLHLLGMKWRDYYFVDMALPFGLRSAPFIFSAIADVVEWILVHNYGIEFLAHYLDDFHTLGPPNSPACQLQLDKCCQKFADWGIPLHPNKIEGPSTCLTILGIELDSVQLQARLPPEKFQRIQTLLEEWSRKRSCRRKELESLIGHLHHACKVAPQGRSFLRRMINLLSAFRRDDHPIRLNEGFHLDLAWWKEFFLSWSGHSFLLLPEWAPLPDFQVSSDAAGAFGFGAFFRGHWFSGAWSAAQLPLSIAYKELFPVVVAAAAWGSQWVSRRVEFCSDNQTVVAVLSSGTSRDPHLMVLLRYLSLLAARSSFAFTASYVEGRQNGLADALSRFQFQRFRQLAPLADAEATAIPPQLREDLPFL